MKTETESRLLRGTKSNRFKLEGSKKEKLTFSLLLLLVLMHVNFEVIAGTNVWQLTIASGIHSFYAPVENIRWENSRLATSVGINRIMGKKQFFALGLQSNYALNSMQGNGTSIQVLGQFTPLVFKKVELGIGTGAGYRFAGYPSSALKWNGTSWEKGRKQEGMIQIPLQLSAGYRSFDAFSWKATPFFAFQMQAMFGYNPDLNPLPDSILMFGLKFNYK